MKRIVTFIAALVILAALIGCNKEDNDLIDNKSDGGMLAYAGVDDLGRVLGMPADKDIPEYNKDKLVGMFYFINHGGKTTQGPYDISKILEKDPEAFKSDERWINAGGGAVNTIHWWGESIFGYFRGSDKWVKQRDVMLLTDAGVDFLILDSSNGATYKEHVLVLLEVLDEFYKQGYKVPKVAFVTKHNPGTHMMEIFNEIYKAHSEYSHLWFELDGKPLILGKTDDPAFTDEFKEFFTIRYSQWPREAKREDGFPWMAFERPQHLFGKELGTTIISVSVAQHTGSLAFSNGAFHGDETVRSRSFHNGKEDKSEDAYLHGYNFAEQFEYAISVDPDIIFVTGWNEWIAYRLNEWYDVTEQRYNDVAIFVDAATANYSRDIQPMKGGYGDNYYMQLIYYIRKFKGAAQVNNKELEENKEITHSSVDIKGDFSQWDDIGTSYVDYAGDTMHRNARGFGKIVYVNETGRNDIVLSKVTHDGENVYFYVETKEPLGPYTDEHWMNLFIKTGNNEDNWYGYDFVINRQILSNTKTVVEKCKGGWDWEKVSEIEYKAEGNKLMFSIPKNALGLDIGSEINIEFKWSDNYQGEGDFWSFYLDGDTAPYGRLNYVFVN